MLITADHLAALATTPVEGDSPAGHRVAGFGKLDDLVFAKLFNTLQPDPESVNWTEVLEEGTRLLERSRDLRFARWVAHALLETRGLEGLELGIQVLGNLAATFGEKLLPLDNEKRIREISGFDEFGATTLERLEPRNGDPGRTIAALESFEGNFACFPGDASPRLKRIGDWLSKTFPEAKSDGESTSTQGGKESGEIPAGTEAAAEETTGVGKPTPDAGPEQADASPESSPPKSPARFQDIGSSPVSGTDPAGPRLTDWGRLATEYFQKLSSPTAAGEIDWRNVRGAALELLEHSKDIRAALVASSGLMRTEGLVGLADGLELLALLGDSFGDGLHPRDPGDRLKKIVAFDLEASTWFAEKKGGIRSEALEMLDRVVQKTQQARGALGAICGDNMIFVRLGKAAGDHQRLLQAEIDEKKAAAAAPPPPTTSTSGSERTTPHRSASAGASAASLASSIETPDQAKRALADAQKLIQTAARFYRDKKSGGTSIHRLERVGMWMRVTDTPKDGVITGPSPETAERLIQESGTGQASLDELEKIARERIFWLTAQRLICVELVRQKRQEEADSIRTETAAFVASLPGIAAIKFKEGVPLIDEETLDWLGSSAEAGGAGVSEVVRLDSEEDQESRRALREEAKELASEGKLPEAIALYQAAWQQSRSARQSFLWKLELARFCASRNASIATSILNDLVSETVAKDIATWEPDLAITVYTELLKLTPERDSIRRAELFGKLVLVDPQRAATLQFTSSEKKSASAI